MKVHAPSLANPKLPRCGVKHELARVAEGDEWDTERQCERCARIVKPINAAKLRYLLIEHRYYVKEVATVLGIRTSSVYKQMKRYGLTRAKDHFPRRNPPKKEFCKRGHPLKDENLRLRKNGTRSCKACERLMRDQLRDQNRTQTRANP